MYDKYQTRKTREKWCNLVSHIAEEPLSSHTMPRKMTVYLAAPPGDGLRSAREHFHTYVKPVLVAAAMDWDVIEGRKEGDVRFKTAERIRKKRKRRDEGEPLSEEELEKLLIVDGVRANNGTTEYEGVAGDLVIGRHTWKEYVRGLHEGWLGPVDPPKQPEADQPPQEAVVSEATASHPSLSDRAVKAAVGNVMSPSNSAESSEDQPQDASPVTDAPPEEQKSQDEKKEEDEKPKPRQPPPYIQPSDYPSALVSPNIPDLIGPSIGVRLPHILGFRNTPIRIYRFFTRRRLADSIGRDVAAAILASYRPYDTDVAVQEDGKSENQSAVPEQKRVLQQEERDWWKTTYQPRKEHEESVWIEDVVLDERITSRMRSFQLTAEDEDRAKRLGDGTEKVLKKPDLADDDG